MHAVLAPYYPRPRPCTPERSGYVITKIMQDDSVDLPDVPASLPAVNWSNVVKRLLANKQVTIGSHVDQIMQLAVQACGRRSVNAVEVRNGIRAYFAKSALNELVNDTVQARPQPSPAAAASPAPVAVLQPASLPSAAPAVSIEQQQSLREQQMHQMRAYLHLQEQQQSSVARAKAAVAVRAVAAASAPVVPMLDVAPAPAPVPIEAVKQAAAAAPVAQAKEEIVVAEVKDVAPAPAPLPPQLAPIIQRLFDQGRFHVGQSMDEAAALLKAELSATDGRSQDVCLQNLRSSFSRCCLFSYASGVLAPHRRDGHTMSGVVVTLLDELKDDMSFDDFVALVSKQLGPDDPRRKSMRHTTSSIVKSLHRLSDARLGKATKVLARNKRQKLEEPLAEAQALVGLASEQYAQNAEVGEKRGRV